MMMNRIIISDRIVELQTSSEFVACEIRYRGILNIRGLLDESIFYVHQGKNTIMILNFSRTIMNKLELFSYVGKCDISGCILVDKDYNKYVVDVLDYGNQSWNKLNEREDEGSESKKITWDYLTIKYIDMKHNGRNDNTFYYKKVKDYNAVERKYERNEKEFFSKAAYSSLRYYRSKVDKINESIGSRYIKQVNKNKNLKGEY